MHRQLEGVAALLAYSVSCALLHSLLQHHYLDTCRSSWLSLFSVDPGPYCGLIRKGLCVLQWSPVVALVGAPRLFRLQQA